MTRLPPKNDPPRGVLDGQVAPADLDIGYGRWHPPSDLAPFVEHFWSVRWNLTTPLVRQTLPHPSVHWVTEGQVSEVGGIERGRFVRVIEGRGRVMAAKFRPGGFCAFYARPQHELTGKRRRATELLGVDGDFAARVMASSDDDALALLVAALRARQPERQPRAEEAERIVAAIAADSDLISVARVSERFGVAPLALQRLFQSKIGIAPKWVIQRYRLHEALARIHTAQVSWAQLAHELGFTDQAHFARTFKRFIGRTPGEYARGLR